MVRKATTASRPSDDKPTVGNRAPGRPDVLVLLSGGVDSIACARWAQKRGRLAACVTFDYGQPATFAETRAAYKWCASERVKHLVRTVALDASRLATGDANAPRVVPGRNAALLAVGANVAASVGASTLVFGATKSDAHSYPDCRPEFVRGLSAVLEAAYGVSVEAPLLGSEKAEVVAWLSESDRELSFSCYTPDGMSAHCGRCRSCIERAAALAASR